MPDTKLPKLSELSFKILGTCIILAIAVGISGAGSLAIILLIVSGIALVVGLISAIWEE